MSHSALALFCVAGISVGASASADVITDWNQHALNSVVTASSPPPLASRNLAMVQAAVFDAVNGIDGSYRSYKFRSSASVVGAQREAAAVAAAHRVLVGLYPAQTAALDTLKSNALSALPALGRSQGEAVGVDVGQQMLTFRSTDGSTATSTYQPANPPIPGRWQRTAAANPNNPLSPQWGGVTPFGLSSGTQFQPAAPPALGSAAYTAAYNEVKAIGSTSSATRTADQTSIARAWGFGGGTITPPGAWNRISQQLLGSPGRSLVDNARAFAMLNVAMADAGIACWDAKFVYDLWRPITAIQQGDNDTNNDTVGDATWTSLLTTPNFPAYTSGHSTFSRSAAVILAEILGTDAINISFSGDNGEVRLLTSLDAAANEAGLSRVYGGIHYDFDNIQGQACGLNVANWVIGNYFQIPAPGAAGLLGLAGLLCGGRRRR